MVACLARSALAEDRDARARDELERALHEMVKLPPATVEVVFDGIDSTRYKLLEGSFALDDQQIPFHGGSNMLFSGEVSPGQHTLSTALVYEAPSPSQGSVKYKVPGKFIFTAQRGVLMRVRARIEVDDGAEPSKRLQLMGQAETDLRAKLEDPLPAPAERADVASLPKPALAAAAPLPKTREPPRDKLDAAAPIAPPAEPAAPNRKATRAKPPQPVEKKMAEAPAEKPKQAPGAPADKHAPSLASPSAGEPGPSPANPSAEEARSSPANPSAEEPRPSAASPAPIAVEQPALRTPPPLPVPPNAEPPAPAFSWLRRGGTAIAGSAMALIGLLLFAASRKKR